MFLIVLDFFNISCFFYHLSRNLRFGIVKAHDDPALEVKEVDFDLAKILIYHLYGFYFSFSFFLLVYLNVFFLDYGSFLPFQLYTKI
jgi:hypothetical protein